MKVIYSEANEITRLVNTGIGLGNFDGLHIGHMALINTLVSECRLSGLNSVVYTFDRHPENIIRKKLFTPMLTSNSKKIELLGETKLDYLYFDNFDENFSRMAPEDFVKNILVECLDMKLAVAGFDYRFGFNGEGSVELLKELGKKYQFSVLIIPPVKVNDNIAGSTAIRKLVAKGDMENVFKMLGRHYSITGTVMPGRHIGTTLGFPTANIMAEPHLSIPHNGVYITRTLLDGKIFNSLTNIGMNPTFEGLSNISVETHILDFGQDIYNKHIEVFFLSKIRSERKFSSVSVLVEQIKKDVKKARSYFR